MGIGSLTACAVENILTWVAWAIMDTQLAWKRRKRK